MRPESGSACLQAGDAARPHMREATESERPKGLELSGSSVHARASACGRRAESEDTVMRLRNIPRAEGVLKAHPIVVKDEKIHKGKWKQEFGSDNPIHIEIGMGKGSFLLTMAERNPKINYIGIERYSSVLLRAVEKYEERQGGEGLILIEEEEKPDFKIYEELPNIRFICMDAAAVTDVFAPGEIQRVYLNFSDPWPKKRHAGRRLTSRAFLERYGKILTDNGTVEFKTDNSELFRFSLEEAEGAGWKLAAHTWDLHKDERMNQGNVMTEYEAKFSGMGNPIHKLIAERQTLLSAGLPGNSNTR